MKIGITGHQERDGIEWPWVSRVIHDELLKCQPVESVLSCLATGSDQVFAEVALSLDVPVVAVLPVEAYERFFEGQALENYRRLLSRCSQINLNEKGNAEVAFLKSGKFVVDNCDVMFAVWDGEASEGLGGTGDIVDYARAKQRPVIHINPIERIVARI